MEIVFVTLKRRRRGVFRAVAVPDRLTRPLGRVRDTLNPSTRVWSFPRASAYQLIKDCMGRAGIAGGMASPKGLRHGFCHP
jgi:site-specific recombinase XerD